MAKPELILLPGKLAFDPEALAEFYARLTNRELTPEMVEKFHRLMIERGLMEE